ncbi:hypothetical protein [Roseomonas xinghualingensis]|uniref:hypothetical protein n=1 Tax=Roseomonas xinghualingensis TaxID=2986475 RepID=UPI0021F0D98E|nr:hypothetical protein [Roseomonas sp. SXEYE001]MCV4207539.1 hypothetical protein [Roseomonas sp. SXEYE001]
MSATAEAHRVRSNAANRADEIVAAFERCTDAASVMCTIDRALRSMDALRQLDDQTHWQRADAARAAAYQRHVKPPIEEGTDA